MPADPNADRMHRNYIENVDGAYEDFFQLVKKIKTKSFHLLQP